VPKPLSQLLLEEEIRRLQKDLERLDPDYVLETPYSHVDKSQYMKNVPINSGPEFLTVHATMWPTIELWVDGHEVRNLDNARQYASTHGYKGIRIVFAQEETVVGDS
jgi:hypothetical protein